MRPLRERQVVAGVRAVDVEPVGILEHGVVAIGRAETQRERGAGREGLTGDLDVPGRPAGHELDRRLPPQRFLDGRRDQGAVGAHLVEL